MVSKGMDSFCIRRTLGTSYSSIHTLIIQHTNQNYYSTRKFMVMIYRVDLSQVCLFTYPPNRDWQVKYLCYTLTCTLTTHTCSTYSTLVFRTMDVYMLSFFVLVWGRLYEVVGIRSQLKARVLSQ